jgi:2-polyprenyl-3-methyl-5-hydroxy-6-metoxy-1,4-benzoquinol methylase
MKPGDTPLLPMSINPRGGRVKTASWAETLSKRDPNQKSPSVRDWESHIEEVRRREVAFRVLEAIVQFARPAGGISVLDVGGGSGVYLLLIEKLIRLRRAVLVEVQPPPERLPPWVEYVRCTAESVDRGLESQKFDVILMVEVIEHLENPDKAIMACRSLLSKGGILVVTTPNLSSLLNRFALLIGMMPMQAEVSTARVFGRPGVTVVGHLRLFTFRSLIEFLQYYRFRVLRVQTVPESHQTLETVGWLGSIAYRLDKVVSRINSKLGSRIVVVAEADDPELDHGT